MTQHVTRPRVVVIGAGFAGLNAAKALAHAPVHVTVVDRKNHHTFQPLLYQVALAVLSPAEIASPVRTVLRRAANTEVLLGEVKGFDLQKRLVLLDDLDLPYDYLIVAAGATHAYFGHPEWEEFAPGLKTLEDATEIRRRILMAFETAERELIAGRTPPPLNFVVVGAGPTGVELAGAISDIAGRHMTKEFRLDRSAPVAHYFAGRWPARFAYLSSRSFRQRRTATQRNGRRGSHQRHGH